MRLAMAATLPPLRSRKSSAKRSLTIRPSNSGLNSPKRLQIRATLVR
jgi:hypothetical protein